MNRVIIVDDDMIVRVTLRSLVKWEDFGFAVGADFSGGKAALEYFKSHRADLLIVDMKMPDLDGISLMEQLQAAGKLPVTVALSGYNEFALVRQAFRLGAFDYLLKSDLTAGSLAKLLEKLNGQIFLETAGEKKAAAGGSHLFCLEELSGLYGILLFEVDDWKRQTARFGENLAEQLEKPVVELARQLPRVAARGRLEAIDPLHYLLAYQVGDKHQYHHTICSIVRQLQSVWRDYMNLTLSAAVSEPCEGEGMYAALQKNSDMVKLSVLYGRGAVCTEWEQEKELEAFLACRREENGLASALYQADPVFFQQERKLFFTKLSRMEFQAAFLYSLGFIALLAERFRQYEDDFSALFAEEFSYREKLGRLKSYRELELWLNNYFRWVMDYTKNRSAGGQAADAIVKARQFMADNYANPELTLKSVADFVGLNEKYFSSRFTKESGMTFSSCLTDIRMQQAKALMASTDFRMYEVSERVGYHNVEHFNRMFKRSFGVSPGDYRKSLTKHQEI
ncbi:MAG: response regulator [Lachnospiraceae bacterium]|nr:response regulator [Lachnospiraceae bacterium]